MIWSRKELKKNAKKSLKKNYWFVVAVVFILSFIGVEQASSTGIIHETTQEDTAPDNLVTEQTSSFSNYDTLLTTIDAIRHPGQAPKTPTAGFAHDMVGIFFDTYTESASFLFKFIGSGQKFFLEHEFISGILLVIAAVGSVIWSFLILNLLAIGKRRFLMENRVAEEGKEHHTRIGRIFFLFHRGKMKNAAIVMLLRSIFQGLWIFTIIGGFIKHYEYMMIPYILAENPYTPRREAFRLSKELTRGYKWKLFILDASFLLWNATVLLTLGLSSIFFVSPYYSCTRAEAFFFLRKNVIEQKMTYYEWFNVRSFDLPDSYNTNEKEDALS